MYLCCAGCTCVVQVVQLQVRGVLGIQRMYFCAGRSNIPARCCWGSSWMYSCCAGRSTTRTGCTGSPCPCGCACVMHIGRDVLGVNVDVLYSRSLNYTKEMCWGSMWMYVCYAGRSTTWTRCTASPCGCTCVVQAVHALFRSFNYTDEMCWGSMWMYKATGDDKYLTEARQWFDTQPDWGMSWDDKVVGCQVRLLWIV